MRALTLGPKGPVLSTRHAPIERGGEAIIRLDLGGICATDLELVKGYMGFQGVLGHEWVGTVREAVSTGLCGQRVVGDINCPCGSCPTCLSGRRHHCPQRTVLGILNRDGAFSEYFYLPESNLHLVPEGVSDEEAVFVEPLAASCRILEQCHISPSDRVTVLGLGRLGQLCARVLALTGARVMGVSRSNEKLNLLPSGIESALVSDVVREEPHADVVVDCTGSGEGLAMAQSMLRAGGRLVLKSTTHDLPQSLHPSSWVIDELTVVGSRCGPFEAALRLLQMGAVDPRPLITARYSLDDGVEALRAAARPPAVKILIEP